MRLPGVASAPVPGWVSIFWNCAMLPPGGGPGGVAAVIGRAQPPQARVERRGGAQLPRRPVRDQPKAPAHGESLLQHGAAAGLLPFKAPRRKPVPHAHRPAVLHAPARAFRPPRSEKFPQRGRQQGVLLPAAVERAVAHGVNLRNTLLFGHVRHGFPSSRNFFIKNGKTVLILSYPPQECKKKGGPARAAKKRTDCRKKKPAVENRAAG